jgi:hypothetical protein
VEWPELLVKSGRREAGEWISCYPRLCIGSRRDGGAVARRYPAVGEPLEARPECCVGTVDRPAVFRPRPDRHPLARVNAFPEASGRPHLASKLRHPAQARQAFRRSAAGPRVDVLLLPAVWPSPLFGEEGSRPACNLTISIH